LFAKVAYFYFFYVKNTVLLHFISTKNGWACSFKPIEKYETLYARFLFHVIL